MKKDKKWLRTLKEIFTELSVIPVFIGFMAVAVLIIFLLPDGFVTSIPFEVLMIITAVVVLIVLYAVAGIVSLLQKKKKCKTDTSIEQSDIEEQ